MIVTVSHSAACVKSAAMSLYSSVSPKFTKLTSMLSVGDAGSSFATYASAAACSAVTSRALICTSVSSGCASRMACSSTYWLKSMLIARAGCVMVDRHTTCCGRVIVEPSPARINGHTPLIVWSMPCSFDMSVMFLPYRRTSPRSIPRAASKLIVNLSHSSSPPYTSRMLPSLPPIQFRNDAGSVTSKFAVGPLPTVPRTKLPMPFVFATMPCSARRFEAYGPQGFTVM